MQDEEIEAAIRLDPRAFGRRLLQLQIGAGIPSATLAAAAGLSVRQLEAIEDVRREEPLSADTARRLAAALDVLVEDLFLPPA